LENRFQPLFLFWPAQGRPETTRKAQKGGNKKVNPHETAAQTAKTPSGTASAREADAIYQRGRIEARVANADVNTEEKTIRFGEVYNSDYLILADECEYQQYRIMVRKVEYATKEDKSALHKGRILRGVTAEILGYREQ
jgi:hypothetical protein